MFMKVYPSFQASFSMNKSLSNKFLKWQYHLPYRFVTPVSVLSPRPVLLQFGQISRLSVLDIFFCYFLSSIGVITILLKARHEEWIIWRKDDLKKNF